MFYYPPEQSANTVAMKQDEALGGRPDSLDFQSSADYVHA